MLPRAVAPVRLVVAAVLLVLVSATCRGDPSPYSAHGHRAAPASPITRENARPGTRGWRVDRTGPQHAIEGYADRVSVPRGGSFRLYVSTTAHGFRAEAFRMGWYGGAQARRVWTSGHVTGRRQPGPYVTGDTNTVETRWRPSLTVDTQGWPVGDYLLRLDADSGARRYVPVTVRSGNAAGKVVIMNAVTTWQAYNAWGGHSLYHGPGGKGDFDHRSRAVSFDRPYDGNGARLFLAYEQPAVALAERMGLPLAYVTNVDLARDPHLLDGARAVISLGHDEYWTSSMRGAVTSARDRGTNVAFLGANASFRHIRLARTGLGPDRLVICYKRADEDPLYGKDDAEVTSDWREPPDPRPESVMTGTYYECNPADAAYVVTAPGSWLFAGTGARKGTRFTGLVGPEYDRVDPGVPIPRPIEVLSHSPLTCRGVHSYADSAYYTVRSGAAGFDAGTMRWVCAIGGHCGHGVDAATSRFVTRVTENLLRAFAAGPAGRARPARDNEEEMHEYPGDPIAARHDLW